MNSAIFITTDQGYIQYANALLNSLDKHGINSDVYILHYNLNNDKYLSDIQSAFSYKIISIEIKDEDFNIDSRLPISKNLFIKQSRFKYIYQNGGKYDVICMLDADMFVVSNNFKNLFELVKNTNKLIGCNERFKWQFGPQFLFGEEEIFKESFKAFKFSCSVPIIFDLNKWKNVFEYYNKLAYHGYEKTKDGIKRIGDMYCWNISVYKHNRQNDVILFPMQTMTQVHQTNLKKYTSIQNYDGYWMTYDGDEVFTIHGRIGNKNWYDSESKKIDDVIKDMGITDKVDNFKNMGIKTLNLIRKEWFDLNFKHKVNLEKYVDMQEYWKEFIK